MKRTKSRSFITSAAMTAWLSCTSLASADLMNLSDVPLFLGFRSEPNIFFVIDDSGSMDWEVLTTDTSQGSRFTGLQPNGANNGLGPVKHRDSDDDGTADCGFNTNGQDFFGYIYGVEFGSNTYHDDSNDCNTADDRSWRFRTNAFNALYFDPHRIYSPWKGLNKKGDPFPQMSANNALADPYDPDNSETIDLLNHNSNWGGGTTRNTSDRDGDGFNDGFFFYTWTDTNANGLFDNGEQTEHQLNSLDQTFLDSLQYTFGQGAPVTAEMVQTNFANWFSYHRSREHVSKAAYGEVIAGATDVRMGLTTLHDHNNVTTEIRSMNTDPTTGDKKALMDQLYSIHSNNGTPLRNALYDAGRYLECDSDNTIDSTCPALPVSEGGACQQNFAIVMTDGFYNGGSPGVGNTDENSENPFDGGAYADDEENTLADIAMHFYERDLHHADNLPDLDNHVPITPGIDEARHQHMVTYTVAFGVNGNLTSMPPNNTDPFADWPDGSFTETEKIDDLRHAAYNGRGEFLNASRPEELIDALNNTLSSIADRVSSAASVALNSGSHNADSRIFQARFNSGDWSGQLLAYPIDEDGNVQPAAWDASEILDTKNWDTERTIITYNDESNQGVEFRWNKLTQTMKDTLNLDANGNTDTYGEKRLEYLRGSKEKESQLFRVRLHTLGDLIHSDPFFVGPPENHDRLGAGYSNFRKAHANRPAIVYVGGNDGMLHGFRADNGEEKLAYVPRYLYPRLSQLTNPVYQHQYFVDGAPTVGDAYGQLCGDNDCWRSILVGSMRKGGQAVFALDVTDPNQFNENDAEKIALWEFTDQDDADLGYTFGQVSIVKMANNKWAAVVGNGYNNTEDDTAQGGNQSTSGHAVLYILFLDRGLNGTWTLGTDYIKLDTSVGEVGTPNGLASPSPVDVDGDFKIDYIYAGDLRGNVWKFDVGDTNPGNWGAPTLLFTAKISDTEIQPITSRLEAGRHPDEGILIYFGTGKYIEAADNTTSIGTQTFYGIWDKLNGTQALVERSQLLEQTIDSSLTNGHRTSSANEIKWDHGEDDGEDRYHGWYIDLPTAGERQVSRSILRSGRIIFTTLIPDTEPCSFGGNSWLMELDAISGSRLSKSPFDLNDDKEFDEQDLVNVSVGGTSEQRAISGMISDEGILPTPTILHSGSFDIKFGSGTKGGIFKVVEEPGSRARSRLAWRQLQ